MGTVWATSVPMHFVAGVLASAFNALSFTLPARWLQDRSVYTAVVAVAVIELIGFFSCIVAGDDCFLRIQLVDLAVPILVLLWGSLYFFGYFGGRKK